MHKVIWCQYPALVWRSFMYELRTFAHQSPAIICHYNDVIMSAMASQTPASRLFTQPFIQGTDQRKLWTLYSIGNHCLHISKKKWKKIGFATLSGQLREMSNNSKILGMSLFVLSAFLIDIITAANIKYNKIFFLHTNGIICCKLPMA